jgi:hypothetical protein
MAHTRFFGPSDSSSASETDEVDDLPLEDEEPDLLVQLELLLQAYGTARSRFSGISYQFWFSWWDKVDRSSRPCQIPVLYLLFAWTRNGWKKSTAEMRCARAIRVPWA